MMLDIQKQIQNLTDELNLYSKQYYMYDNSLVEDEVYDGKYRALVALEKEYPTFALPYSPTLRIGDGLKNEFKKITHRRKMDSLQDAFRKEEVEKFVTKIQAKLPESVFVVEPKIDGLSVVLTYENGIFVKGATRGDGFVGEDVTQNLRTISSLPLKLDTNLPVLEVRGEVYLKKENFLHLVKQQEEAGEEPFKNPRNAAAGSLRQKNVSVVAERKLDIIIFNMQYWEGMDFSSHEETLLFLKDLGFCISSPLYVENEISGIWAGICTIEEQRNKFFYDIDGVVVKLNHLKDRVLLGDTDKTPKWALAFKYPAEQKRTKLLSIEINVGRTGVLTPTAIFEEVQLAGTSVCRAVLHNQDFINEKKICVGDEILVRKAGDIIPEVVEVIKHHKQHEIFQLPSLCPSCGSLVKQMAEEVAMRCMNEQCPARLYKKMVHFACRNAMNIEGLGEKVIETLIQQGLVVNIEDLYSLKKEELLGLDRFAEKSVDNLFASIEKSKSNGLDQLIFGLGIPNIGKKAAKLLGSKFKNMDNLSSAKEEEILQIDGFGKMMATHLVAAFQTPQLQQTIVGLKQQGMNMGGELERAETTSLWAEKKFVITGTFQGYTRKEMEGLIEKHGGFVMGSVSKNIDFLVAGEKAGSKLEKAKKLSISVLTQQEFENLLQP